MNNPRQLLALDPNLWPLVKRLEDKNKRQRAKAIRIKKFIAGIEKEIDFIASMVDYPEDREYLTNRYLDLIKETQLKI